MTDEARKEEIMKDTDDCRTIMKELGPPPIPDPDDISDRYFELIYAVRKKHPGETRHQTALRYIKQGDLIYYTFCKRCNQCNLWKPAKKKRKAKCFRNA